MCLDYVRRRHYELSEQYPDTDIIIEAESRSNPGELFGRDDWWGTCDITITVWHEEVPVFLEVIDYKDGRGYVSEKNNTQLMSYLGGKIGRHNIEACRTTIVQPKTNTPVRYVDVDPTEVTRVLFELSKAAQATDDPDAPLNSGKHCQWCRHKKNCTEGVVDAMKEVKAMTDVKIEGGESLFELIEKGFKDVTALGGEQLADLLDTKSTLMAQFAKVEEEIERRLDTGESVIGYAMAPGRGKNVWNADDKTIATALKGRRLKLNDVYPQKIISPAQMQKLTSLTDTQKERLTTQFVEYTPGSLKLKKVARQVATEVDFSAEIALKAQAQEPVTFF